MKDFLMAFAQAMAILALSSIAVIGTAIWLLCIN